MAITTSESPSTLSSSQRKHEALQSSITLSEKVNTIPTYLIAFANLFTALLTGPFRSKERRHPSLLYHVILTAYRTLAKRLSARQIGARTPHTDDVYKAFCKKKGIEPRSEMLEDGTAAHWIGREGAEKIILNFPGGGYVIPASPNQFEFSSQMFDIQENEGKSVAYLFLSYDLAPQAPYPRQLEQATLLLRHVIENLHYDPASIIVMGDSAGGNLAFSLLSHLAHPHPSVPALKLSSPLLGAIVISPWIDFNTDPSQYRESFTKYKYHDLIDGQGLNKWSAAFLNGKESDSYNEPVKAEPGWWKEVGEVVNGIFVVGGGAEVMIGSILELTTKMQQTISESTVELFVGPGEIHDNNLIDLTFGVKLGGPKEGQMSLQIRKWITTKL